jgi:hypothetical protein
MNCGNWQKCTNSRGDKYLFATDGYENTLWHLVAEGQNLEILVELWDMPKKKKTRWELKDKQFSSVQIITEGPSDIWQQRKANETDHFSMK